jgi:hypothetical protein
MQLSPKPTAIKRRVQLLSWILMGALVGFIQGIGTQVRVGGNLDFLLTVPLLFGMGWLSTAFLVSDFVFLRRGLTPHEFLRFLAVVAACALILGFILWGWGLMVGFPLTAVAILCTGASFRKTTSQEEVHKVG